MYIIINGKSMFGNYLNNYFLSNDIFIISKLEYHLNGKLKVKINNYGENCYIIINSMN